MDRSSVPVAELIQNIYSTRQRPGTCVQARYYRSTNHPTVLLSIQLIETSRLEYLCPSAQCSTAALHPIDMTVTPNPGSAPLSLGVQDLSDGGHCTMGIPCIIAALRKAVREPYSSTDVSTG